MGEGEKEWDWDSRSAGWGGCKRGKGETVNVCYLGIKGGFCERLVIIRVGGEEAGLPGKIQEMEEKGRT